MKRKKVEFNYGRLGIKRGRHRSSLSNMIVDEISNDPDLFFLVRQHVQNDSDAMMLIKVITSNAIKLTFKAVANELSKRYVFIPHDISSQFT